MRKTVLDLGATSVTSYIDNIYKYKQLVESNKGKLIFGIQGLNYEK